MLRLCSCCFLDIPFNNQSMESFERGAMAVNRDLDLCSRKRHSAALRTEGIVRHCLWCLGLNLRYRANSRHVRCAPLPWAPTTAVVARTSVRQTLATIRCTVRCTDPELTRQSSAEAKQKDKMERELCR